MRTENFPDWEIISGAFGSSSLRVDDHIVYRELSFVYTLMGMQIGSSGFVAPGTKEWGSECELLCSLSGIAPVPNRPYPFLDHPSILDEDAQSEWVVPLSEVSGPDGFGILYVLRKRSGDLIWIHQQL